MVVYYYMNSRICLFVAAAASAPIRIFDGSISLAPLFAELPSGAGRSTLVILLLSHPCCIIKQHRTTSHEMDFVTTSLLQCRTGCIR